MAVGRIDGATQSGMVRGVDIARNRPRNVLQGDGAAADRALVVLKGTGDNVDGAAAPGVDAAAVTRPRVLAGVHQHVVIPEDAAGDTQPEGTLGQQSAPAVYHLRAAEIGVPPSVLDRESVNHG